jgi:hypothetical protein
MSSQDTIRILIRDADDWREYYVDNDLVYEGHDSLDRAPLTSVFKALRSTGFNFEIRIIFLNISPDTDESDIPLHCFTKELYFEDWESAEPWSLDGT